MIRTEGVTQAAMDNDTMVAVTKAIETLAASRHLIGKYCPDHHWLPEHDQRIADLRASLARHQSGRTGAGEALEERALAIVKAHYPEMPDSYRGRRYQVALAAIIETRAEIIRSLRHDFDDWPDYVALADVADELEKDDSQ